MFEQSVENNTAEGSQNVQKGNLYNIVEEAYSSASEILRQQKEQYSAASLSQWLPEMPSLFGSADNRIPAPGTADDASEYSANAVADSAEATPADELKAEANQLPEGPIGSDQSTSENAEGKVCDTAPTATDFLKEHGDLAVPDNLRAKAEEYDQLMTGLEEHAEQHDQVVDSLMQSQGALLEDLMKAGVSTPEQYEALPAEQRQQFDKRVEAINREIAKMDELDKQMQENRKQIEALKHAVPGVDSLQDKLQLETNLQIIDGLDPEARASIYKSFDTILGADTADTTQLTTKEKAQVVSDLARQIACPEEIDQGNKGTCAVARTEYILAKDHPEVYAQSVAEWATTGELSTLADVCLNDGAKIVSDAIHQDDGNSERSLASKVFQTGAATLAVMQDGLRYENYDPTEAPLLSDGTVPRNDTGERLVDEEGKISDWTGLGMPQEVDLLNTLVGDGAYTGARFEAKSAEALQLQLEQLASTQGYPLQVNLDFGNSAHAVSVLGIDKSKSPAEVIYNDTATASTEPTRVSLDKFYTLAMRGYHTKVEIAEGQYALVPYVNRPPYVEVLYPSAQYL